MGKWIHWKMKSKIISTAVFILLFVSITLIVTNNYFTSKGFEIAAETEILSYKRVVDNTVDTQVKSLKESASLLAGNQELRAMLVNGTSSLNDFANRMNKLIKADELLVVNSGMQIIASSYSGDTGLANGDQPIIRKAVNGESNSGIDLGPDNKLYFRSACPVMADDRIIGAVVTGVRITGSSNFVDKIKTLCDVECTIFHNDERVSTSIIKEGKRAVGTKMDNPKVIETVLNNGKEFVAQNVILGRQFQTYYWPIKDFTGKIIGMHFIGKDRHIIESSYSSILYSSVTVIIIVGLIIILLSFSIAKKMVQPLHKLVAFATSISEGDVNLEIEDGGGDEIGVLYTSFKKMTGGIKEKAEHLDLLSKGNLNIHVEEKSEKDILAKSINNISDILTNVKKETGIRTEAAVKGDLNIRGDAGKYQGGFREIIEGFNNTIAAIVTPINETAKVIEELSKGNLTARLEGAFEGKYSELQNDVNNLGAALNSIIGEITEAVQSTASASAQISSSTEEMATGAGEQSEKVTEVAASVDEMTKTILASSQNITNVSETAKKSGRIADSGGAAVDNTVKEMNKISQVINQAASIIEELGASSKQIGEIVQVINDIADQTNLLALNAAIEAARAGEQGRGFAVVADEVRKLAERTAKATKEIADMIKLIQKNTVKAVEAVRAGTTEAETGRDLASQAGESLKEIIDGSKTVVDMVTQVEAASEQQTTAAEEISRNIESINLVSRETASGIQQIAKAAEDLNRLTEDLSGLLSRFRTDLSERNVKGISYGTRNQIANH